VGRFLKQDEQALTELRQELSVLRTDPSEGHDRILDALSRLLGLEQSSIYDLEQGNQDLRIGLFNGRGFQLNNDHIEAGINEALGGAEPQWGIYNAARPEPEQRDRTVAIASWRVLVEALREQAEQRKLGLGPARALSVLRSMERMQSILQRAGAASAQLRVLACQDESLLAWVGGFREEPFTDREVRLLDALVPALQRRFSLERLLERGPLWESAVEVTLEAVPRVAFITDEAGRVLHANSAGRAVHDAHPSETRAALREALAAPEESSGYRRSAIQAAGRAPIYLLVQLARGGLDGQVAVAARRWGLTARQTEVLALLVSGEANKTISAKLLCAERTTELHVTTILRKAQVDSRAALLAKFFLQSAK
jgi:DNA-binding CsgD family transcriptional regulator